MKTPENFSAALTTNLALLTDSYFAVPFAVVLVCNLISPVWTTEPLLVTVSVQKLVSLTVPSKLVPTSLTELFTFKVFVGLTWACLSSWSAICVSVFNLKSLVNDLGSASTIGQRIPVNLKKVVAVPFVKITLIRQ
uniref:Uncharacterized protein n=1 Tax=uncultured marine virus TaxID=186617 RepID=A0A0F7L5T0_9VIRU|nr:hypothetical protein [uncultured marine virus]